MRLVVNIRRPLNLCARDFAPLFRTGLGLMKERMKRKNVIFKRELKKFFGSVLKARFRLSKNNETIRFRYLLCTVSIKKRHPFLSLFLRKCLFKNIKLYTFTSTRQ